MPSSLFASGWFGSAASARSSTRIASSSRPAWRYRIARFTCGPGNAGCAATIASSSAVAAACSPRRIRSTARACAASTSSGTGASGATRAPATSRGSAAGRVGVPPQPASASDASSAHVTTSALAAAGATRASTARPAPRAEAARRLSSASAHRGDELFTDLFLCITYRHQFGQRREARAHPLVVHAVRKTRDVDLVHLDRLLLERERLLLEQDLVLRELLRSELGRPL